MRHLAGLICVLVATTATVEAATKLCFANRRAAPTIDVGPDPSMIVARNRLDRFEIVDQANNAVPFTAAPLDESWARVKVTAPVGTVLFSSGVVDDPCHGRHYRVVEQAPPRHASRMLTAATVVVRDDGTEYLELALSGTKEVAWSRLDWAYDSADLDSLYGTEHHTSSSSDMTIPLAPTWQIVVVRLVTFELDGTTATAIRRIGRTAGGSAPPGAGNPPASSRSPAHCDMTAPRPVPVDPTFYFGRTDEFRFAAVSATGAQLPVTLRHRPEWPEPGSVTVTVPEGTMFQLHRLPRPPGCSTARWLRATHDRTHDEAPKIATADGAACVARVALADPDTWGLLEVTTPTGVTEYGLASDAVVTPLDNYTNERRRIQITPRWGATRGTPWIGWVESDPACEGVRFGSLEPPATPHANNASVRPAAGRGEVLAGGLPRGSDTSPTWRSLLAFAMLLAAFAIQPTACRS